MHQDFDDSCVADLFSYVRDELLTDARRAPRRIPAGITGSGTYVLVEYRDRYDYYGSGGHVTERYEYRMTRKLGIPDLDRGRPPFDVTLALRAPEMSEEDAMIAAIEGGDDMDDFVRDLGTPVGYVFDATDSDEDWDEGSDHDEPPARVVRIDKGKRERIWENRMRIKRRLRRYVRHTGAPKRPKYHPRAA